MTRFRIVLEYRGTAFIGWQVQPVGRSVQGVVEEALHTLLGHPTRLAGSGRTDAGVHALGQVAAFDTHAVRTAYAVINGLNALLPQDVACLEAEAVAPDFDPRRQAKRKLYRYSLLERRTRSPLLADRALHVGHPLDVDKMHEAAQLLVGCHDFASFRAAGCASTHAVRTVDAARVRRERELVLFEIEGNGFLRHMVRILAGTLLQVGLGRITIARFAEILKAADRRHCGATVAAHGLTLVSIDYLGPPRADGDDALDE